jgi:hypothetical protein
MGTNEIQKFSAVSKEAVRLIQSKTIAPNVCDRTEDQKTKGQTRVFEATKAGDTMEFVKPIRFRGRNSLTRTSEAIVERKAPLARVEIAGVDVELNILELSDDVVVSKENLKMFSDLYMKPAMETMGALVDGKLLPLMKNAISNSVGTFGSALSDAGIFGQAKAQLNKYEAQKGDRHCIISDNGVTEYTTAVSGFFNPTDEVTKQYRDGMIRKTQNFTFWETDRLAVQVNGTFSGTITIAVAPLEGETSMTLTGFTPGDDLTEGQILYFEDVNRVNPLTYENRWEQQGFVVESIDGVADGSGDMVVTFLEKFEALQTNSFQNISQLPLVGGAVTFDGASDEVSMQNIALHKHAFLWGCTALGNIYQKNSGQEAQIYDEESKIRMKCTTDGDIDTMTAITRFDMAHGLGAYWTPHATRINGAL